MRVKVCGITAVGPALAAVAAGADMIGFIMVPGTPRSVDSATARRISDELPASIERVGVFLNSTAAEVEQVALESGFTAVQLHGSESWEDFRDLPFPILKATRLGRTGDAATPAWPAGLVLLADTHSESLPGGTGRRFPWDWAQDLAEHYRLIVSGGLAAANVAAAVKRLKPFGVDASSRLESAPGIKDPALVTAFVEAARRAEAEAWDA